MCLWRAGVVLRIREAEANFDSDGHELVGSPPNRGAKPQLVTIFDFPTLVGWDSIVSI